MVIAQLNTNCVICVTCESCFLGSPYQVSQQNEEEAGSQLMVTIGILSFFYKIKICLPVLITDNLDQIRGGNEIFGIFHSSFHKTDQHQCLILISILTLCLIAFASKTIHLHILQ